MADDPNWQKATLPDGRTVEYVHATVVGRDGDALIADVTVLIEGVDVGTVQVRIPGAANG